MNKLYILSAILVILTACVHEDMPQVCPSGETTISLSMSKMPVKETRSDAFENLISDACILVFGSDGKYKEGEMVAVATNLKKNQTKNPIIKTDLIISDGETIVVLCNTGLTQLLGLVKGVSTPDDINKLMRIDTEKINEVYAENVLPMSGTAVWNNTIPPTVNMFFSVAKIEVHLSPDAIIDSSWDDVKDAFSGINTANGCPVRWGLFNVVKEGYIYSHNGEFNGTFSAADNKGYSDRSFQNVLSNDFGGNSSTTKKRYYYACEVINENPEFFFRENSTPYYFYGDPCDPYEARPCVILKTNVGYYRIDIVEGNNYDETKKFLDIRRNVNYRINITKVMHVGYRTLEEALTQQGCNLEYDIEFNRESIEDFSGIYGWDIYTYYKASSFHYILYDRDAVVLNVNDPNQLSLCRFQLGQHKQGPYGRTPEVGFARIYDSVDDATLSSEYYELCYKDGTPIVENEINVGRNSHSDEDITGLYFRYKKSAPHPNNTYFEIRYADLRVRLPIR